MERNDFDKARTAFRRNVETGKKLAVTLANAAIEHFRSCGDTSYIADFHADLIGAGKNFVRAGAYLKWLVAHAPVKLEANKFVKDQDRSAELGWGDGSTEAAKALVAKSSEKAFFDFAPEATISNFSAADVIDAVEKIVSRFQNSKKAKAKDATASAKVTALSDFVATLKAAA